jgi:hypothetical protein
VHGQTAKVEATFTITANAANIPQMAPGMLIQITGSTKPPDADAADPDITIQGSGVRIGNTLYMTNGQYQAPQGAVVDETQTFYWTVTFVNSQLSKVLTATATNTTNNTLYILGGNPTKGAKLYETLVDIGTRAAFNAGPGATPAQVVDKVFAAFQAKNITRVDGTKLTYYGDWTTKAQSTAKLLQTGAGQCTAWAKFFIDVLKTQGLLPNGGQMLVVRPKLVAGGEWFLVKNWTFPVNNPKRNYKDNGLGGTNEVYDYRNELAVGAAGDFDPQAQPPRVPLNFDLSRSKNAYQFVQADVDGNKDANQQPRTGLAGQNMTQPFSMFNNHEVVQFGNVIYDPSYGSAPYNQNTEEARLAAMETAAIAGYAVVRRDPKNPGKVFLFIRKPDPNNVGISIPLRPQSRIIY